MITDGTRARSGIADGRADIVTCQRIVARLALDRGIELGGEAAGSGEANPARDTTAAARSASA